MMDRIAMMNLPLNIMAASSLPLAPVSQETTAAQFSPPCSQDSAPINFAPTTFCTEPYMDYTANININSSAGRAKCRTFVPVRDYLNAMQQETGEPVEAFVAHVFFGLAREALIAQDFWFGPAEGIKKRYSVVVDGDGLVFEPSALGIELFLWATGNSSLGIET